MVLFADSDFIIWLESEHKDLDIKQPPSSLFHRHFVFLTCKSVKSQVLPWLMKPLRLQTRHRGLFGAAIKSEIGSNSRHVYRSTNSKRQQRAREERTSGTPKRWILHTKTHFYCQKNAPHGNDELGSPWKPRFIHICPPVSLPWMTQNIFLLSPLASCVVYIFRNTFSPRGWIPGDAELGSASPGIQLHICAVMCILMTPQILSCLLQIPLLLLMFLD